MNKKTRIILSCILVIAALFIGSAEGKRLTSNNKQAEAADEKQYFIDKNNKIKVPEGGVTLEDRMQRGTEGNPFFVLEIVPYEGMASFGYQIAGCEPVDLEKIAWEGSGISMPDNGSFMYMEQNKPLYYWDEEFPERLDKSLGTVEKTKQYGEMEYVVTGGDYVRSDIVNQYTLAEDGYIGQKYKDTKVDGKTVYVADASGLYKLTGNILSATYTKVDDKSGEFIWHPLSVEKCLDLTEEEVSNYENALQNVSSRGDRFKTFFDEVEYVTKNGYKFTHKNIFLTECIGLGYKRNAPAGFIRYADYDIAKPLTNLNLSDPVEKKIYQDAIADYKSVVYSVTPEDLNLNVELVERADMIVITSSLQSYNTYLTLYNNYKKEDLFSKAPEVIGNTRYNKEKFGTNYTTFADNPIDWPIVKAIISKESNSKTKVPVLMESNIVNLSNTETASFQFHRVFGNGTTDDTGEKAGSMNNMYKLFLLLTQMPIDTLNALYQDDSGKLLDGSNFGTTTIPASKYLKGTSTKLTTGTFKLVTGKKKTNYYSWQSSPDIQGYWNIETFLPWSLLPDATYKDSQTGYGPVFTNLGIANDSNAGQKLLFGSGRMQDSVRNFLYVNCGGNALGSDFNNASSSSNVGDDEFGHDPYNFFDEMNGSAARPTKLSPAQVIFSLIANVCDPKKRSEDIEINRDYRVLELQPSSNYKTDSFFKLLLKLYTKTTGEIKVDHLTTSEFIGKREDISSTYDLVYIGMNKNGNDMTMKFTSGTDYVYAHSGPVIELSGKKGLMGLLNGANDNTSVTSYLDAEKCFVYSGNDITKAAFDKIENFRKNGGTLLFADGFFTNDAKTTVASTIDRNSFIYDLSVSGTYTNFSESLLNKGNANEIKKFTESLSASNKLTVKFESSPVLYNDAESDDKNKYVNGGSTDDRMFRFKFDMTIPADKEYFVIMYVDKNGDGRYDISEAVGGNLYRANGYLGSKGSVVGSLFYETGRSYPCTASSSSARTETFYFWREITDRIGSVDWKLDFVDSSTKVVCASLSGVSAIQAKTAKDTVDLPILQIVTQNEVSWATSYGQQNVYLPMEGDDLNGKKLISWKVKKDKWGNVTGLEKEMISPSSSSGNTNQIIGVTKKFAELTSSINGLKIKFTRMTEDELIYRANEKAGNAKGTTGKALQDALDTYLEDYKMLVLGFSDVYSGVTEPDLIQAVDHFRLANKAILYTHDTSSVNGVPGQEPQGWGGPMTNAFRNAFGMDRYSLLNSNALNTSISTDRADWPFVPTSTTASGVDQLITKTAGPNSGKKTFALIQGYTNGYLYQQTDASSSDKTNGNLISTKVKVVNKGGITQYPYTLPEEITIAQTHPQYFQLDLNNPNLNVWYCLGVNSGSSNKYFTATPNDVRNNYYIYNVENITYSGMGHSALDASANLNEIKLFINTFVAAYRATNSPVKAVIDNLDVVNNGNEAFLCVDVDSSNASELIGSDTSTTFRLQTISEDNFTQLAPISKMSKRVKFYINETNTQGLTGAKYWLYFYLKKTAYNPDGSVISTSYEPINLAVYKSSDNSFVDKVSKITYGMDHQYYVDVPLETGSKNEIANTELLIYVSPQYSLPSGALKLKETEDAVKALVEEEKRTTKLTIMPRGLFNLD